MSKEEWMVNILNNGVAVQMLEKYTNQSKEWWMDRLGEIANEQFQNVLEDTPELIEQTIKLYADASDD